MGLRGPQPKPTALKIRNGTFRPARDVKDEAPAIGRLKAPSRLKKYPDAMREFRRLSAELTKMRLAGSIDSEALARYCIMLVDWWTARENLTKVEIKPGSASPDTIIRGLGQELARMEAAFGMTPSSRSRISILAVQRKDTQRAAIEAPDDYLDDGPSLKIGG